MQSLSISILLLLLQLRTAFKTFIYLCDKAIHLHQRAQNVQKARLSARDFIGSVIFLRWPVALKLKAASPVAPAASHHLTSD